MHAARPQRALGTLEEPKALQQNPHSTLSNTLCKRQHAAFILRMLKTNATTWRSRRLHSLHTALLATSQHTP